MHRLWLPLLAPVIVLFACAAPAAPRDAAPAGAGAAAAGAGAAPAPSAPPERLAVSIGYSPFLSYAQTFIAQDRGYFAEQGIEADLVAFDSAGLMIPPISAGQLDAGGGAPGPALYNALGRGLEFKILMGTSYSAAYLMVRKELVESGRVRDWGDLRGLRVSFHVEGSSADFTMREAFQRYGLTLQDVEVQRLGNPDIPPALANGAVDAAAAPEPVPIAVEAQGTAVRLAALHEVVGLRIAGTVMAGPSLLNRGDADVTRVVTAFVKGQRDYNASIANDRITDPAMREIMSKWTSMPPQTIAQAVSRPGRPTVRSIWTTSTRSKSSGCARGCSASAWTSAS